VLWLRRVDELSQKEVAAKLGISHRTAETYLARAVQVLADALYLRKRQRHGTAKAVSPETVEPDHGER